MKEGLTTAAGIVIGAAFIALAIFATQPRYTVIEVAQSFNNGFGAWRLDMRSGEMSLCSATPGGLVCSLPTIELSEQELDQVAAPVAIEAPAQEAPASEEE